MKITDCQCNGPGWCERHQCRKNLHWYRLCQRKPAFFNAWEAGCGPGQLAGAPSAKRLERQAQCEFRGEVIREEDCISCGGHVRIKVFRCERHGDLGEDQCL